MALSAEGGFSTLHETVANTPPRAACSRLPHETTNRDDGHQWMVTLTPVGGWTACRPRQYIGTFDGPRLAKRRGDEQFALCEAISPALPPCPASAHCCGYRQTETAFASSIGRARRTGSTMSDRVGRRGPSLGDVSCRRGVDQQVTG